MKVIDAGTLWLTAHGYNSDGTPKGAKKEKSVRTVSTPVGGAPRKYGQRFAPSHGK